MDAPHPHHSPLADVVIIGGGAAGLAAALQLSRSRRSVVVVDAGEPRNAPASHMHGYLGHDGLPPGDLLAIGRDEVERYGGTIRPGVVVDVQQATDRFRVVLADGDVLEGRRAVIASGLVDELPDIPGVAERWGRDVLHCPYCHGWEVRDRRIVVIGTGPLAAHQAQLFRQLSGDVTVVVHTGDGPDVEARRGLGARGIELIDRRVDRIVVVDDRITGVRLVDGSVVDADAVVVGTRMVARAGMVAGLGIVPVAGPMGNGEVLETDARGRTSVPGVYAAGNVSDLANQVLQAAAEGSRIGAMVNADLVEEEVERAAYVAGDRAEDWDRRYVARGDQMWSGQVNGALAAEVADLTPGSALDIGCGEGADAIWLAERGWDVTAVDISEVAVERARQLGDAAGAAVEWRAADLVADPPDRCYDLVSAQYPALRKDPEDRALRMLLAAVAPGGTLLVVAHSLEGVEHQHHGWDHATYVLPPDIAPHLGEGWTVEVHETRPRQLPAGDDGPDRPDVVLRARRAG